MPLPGVIEGVIQGALAAFVYATVFYAKKRKKQAFNPRKYAATIVVGVVLGSIMGYAGIAVTQAALTQRLATYGSVIAIVESLIKLAYRELYHKSSGG